MMYVEGEPLKPGIVVRRALGVASVDALLLQSRMKYIARLARQRHPVAWALLQTRVGGEPLPWTAQLANDLIKVHTVSPTARAELPHPGGQVNACVWLDFMTRNSDRWHSIVSECGFSESVFDRGGSETSAPRVLNLGFACKLCGAAFPSSKALGQHNRKRHGAKPIIQTLVGDETTCQNCKTDFVQRFRLIAHSSDSRPNRLKCRLWYAANAAQIPEDVSHDLHCKDLILQRHA